jgi:transposase
MSQARYTDEFKTQAVGQVLERGYSVKEVSERIGVSTYSLYKWIKKDPRNTFLRKGCEKAA